MVKIADFACKLAFLSFYVKLKTTHQVDVDRPAEERLCNSINHSVRV